MRTAVRGQATTEMALLGIALVPIILYAFFLDDLLRFKLDESEAVFSTPWDFTTIDYENIGSGYQAAKANPPSFSHPEDLTDKSTWFLWVTSRSERLTYCDHTSAYASYNQGNDCNDDGGMHHVDLMAHECWITKDAQQVICNKPTNNGMQDIGVDLVRDEPLSGGVAEVNEGGVVACTARVAVVNYFMPQRVLQWFTSKTNVADNNGHGLGSGSADDGTLMTRAISHGDGGVGTHENIHALTNDHGTRDRETGAENVYQMPTEGSAVLVDTWALTTVGGSVPEGHSGPMYDRVNLVYGSEKSQALFLESYEFIEQAISDKTLSPLAATDVAGMSDGLKTPEVMFDGGFSDDGPTQVEGFYSSAWLDGNQNLTRATYRVRSDHYMGRDSIPK